jgi:hypothetical protein
VGAGAWREPGARFGHGEQPHPQVRVGFRELGRGLDAGQPAADHGERSSVGGQVGGPLTQLAGAVEVRDRYGMLGNARRTGRRAAAERVQERVVGEGVAAVEPKLVAVGVDREHPRDDELHPAAAQDVGERVLAHVLAGGDLVQPHPFQEPVGRVDEHHVGVVRPLGKSL